jgi:hypothetical protein
LARTPRTRIERARATPPGPTTETPPPSPPTEVRKLEVSTYYASNVTVSKVANDATLMFAKWVPTVQADGAPSPVAIAEPVALIQMSLQTLKDLSILVGEFVAQIEQEIGQIETDFTRQRAVNASSST